MGKNSRIYVSVSLDNIRHNFDCMRRCLKPGTKICAVIKTDGYGHGALPIAKCVQEDDDIWGFAVATTQEAQELIGGGVTKPVLILGYVFPEDYGTLADLEIRPSVFTMEMALKLSETCVSRCPGKSLPVHIALDTGMSRIGFPADEQAADTVLQISRLPGLRIEGLFTHFARADEADKTTTFEAYRKYTDFLGYLKERGVEIPLCHAANSAAILEYPDSHMDMVRAGITVYGIYPSDEMIRDKDLRPAMELKSHVSHVKDLPEGVPVSYGGTYVTPGPVTVATIPVGYGDGYPRSLSSKGFVLIGGRRAPIIGRVCMDQFMVDVTGMGVKTGDEVTLMGRDGEEAIFVEELSELSGRFPYEFVCDISKRVPRVYS